MSFLRNENCGFMLYHVDVSRIGPWEMERFIKKGYANGYCIMLTHEIGQVIMQCKFAIKNGDAIWLGPEFFNAKNENIESYMKRTDERVQRLKDEGVWDAVVGFHWDEPLYKQSNDDFYQMTKALHEAYGKRIFPVLSVPEIMSGGNHFFDEYNWGDVQMRSYATEFITDVGFDCYVQDVRPEYQEIQKSKFKNYADGLRAPEIVDADSFYRTITKRMKDLMMGEPNVWYYPCAYLYPTWTGGKSDEDYCIAHLEFFLNLLKEEEHPGGIHVYNWKTWYDYRPALDYFLDEDCPERWNRYEEVLKRACKEVNELKLNPYKK